MILEHIQVDPKKSLEITLDQMNYLENLSLKNNSFVSWILSTFNTDCKSCLPGLVWKYVVNNFTYKDDPYDELLIAPYLMNKVRTGDCDDFSLFIKTVLDALGGFYTNYILFGSDRNQFTHIAVFVHRGKIGNQFIDPIIVDGANQNFNIIPKKYKFYKII